MYTYGEELRRVNLMKKYIKIFLVIIFFALTLGTMEQKVNAANFSTNIDAIDESKYPGFKSKIKQLQKTYPNIQILYTGLDWNTVIKNEYNYVHGRNLVSTSLGEMNGFAKNVKIMVSYMIVVYIVHQKMQ